MTYISLLRGINVAGKKKVKMADLKALYLSLGLEEVVTYIQSGNVLFKSDKVSLIMIEDAIMKKYDFNVPIQIREATTFKSLIDNCPFKELDLVEEGSRVMVTFLDKEPTQENITSLLRYVKEPEKLVIARQEIYLYCPNGYEDGYAQQRSIKKRGKESFCALHLKLSCFCFYLSL